MKPTLAIMPTYMTSEDHLGYTMRALGGLHGTAGDLQILVVDDGSPFGLDKLIEMQGKPETTFDLITQHENQGFATTVNQGLRLARKNGQNALLVNADIEFINNGWFQHLLSNPADVVGPMLLYPNGLVQHAGVYFSVIARRFDHMYRLAPRTLAQVNVPQICPVTGALQLIKHNTLKKIGIYDENFRLGFEDIDYCHEVFKAGLKCAYEPKSQAIHHESIFRKPPKGADPWTPESRGSISRKHEEWWQAGWEYLHEKHAGLDFSTYMPTMLEWPE